MVPPLRTAARWVSDLAVGQGARLRPALVEIRRVDSPSGTPVSGHVIVGRVIAGLGADERLPRCVLSVPPDGRCVIVDDRCGGLADGETR